MILTIERWNSLTYSDRSVLLIEAGYPKNSYAGFPYTLLPNDVRHDLNYVLCRHHNRQNMPEVTRIVDEFREHFGGEVKVTYAKEGGWEFGHQSGQVLVEYLLTLSFVAVLVTILGTYLLNKFEAFL